MTTIYSVGTVTVANGGTTVTGVGTSWVGKVFEGDLFTDPAHGLFARVTADATSNTSLTINAWPGTAMAAAAYEVLLQQDSIRMSERMRKYVELAGAIANTGIGIDAFGNFADRAGYADQAAGFAFLSLDGDGALISEAVIFIKASSDTADWSAAIPVRGDKGDQGEPGLGVWEGPWVTATAYAVDDVVEHEGSIYICVVAHTSGAFATDLAAVKWELLVEKGDRGVNWRGAYNGATAYVLDDAVLYNGSTWIALGPTTGNAPPTLPTTSNAYWQLLARQGIDGTGTGDTVGPAGATDNALARFDGSTGKLLQDSAVTVSDAGALSAPSDIRAGGKLAVYGGASERAFMSWDAGSTSTVIDSDGALTFRTNNTVAARLDTAGRLTIAAQPAFLASGGPTQSGGGTVVMFTNVPLNRGSHFNVSNGRFTAPVGGLYHFNGHVLAYNDTDFRLGFYQNGVLVGAEANINAPHYDSCSIAAGLELATGDYVEMRMGGATSNIYSGYRSFSGHLIG